MTPAPILATYIPRRRRGAAVTAERRYPARVLDIRGEMLVIEYLDGDGTLRWSAARADQVEVHP